MAKRETRQAAQDSILAYAVFAATSAEDTGKIEEANEIRKIATRLAWQWGLNAVPGLPETFQKA